MSWIKIDARDAREGDRVRAYRGDFDRIEAVVMVDEENDRYLPWVGMLSNLYRPDGIGDAVADAGWEHFERWDGGAE